MSYSLKDLAKKLDISIETLNLWIEKGLLAGEEFDEYCFSEQAYKTGEIIKKFLALGYSLAEIAKIRQEVGLPLKENLKNQVVPGSYLTVGELAERGGVNTRTIKFWEEKGLLKPAQRSEGGFRLFREEDVNLVKTIKDLQTFNYTLSEIGNILRLLGPEPEDMQGLEGLKSEELEKISAALNYLIERMQETRKASQRVESLFARRLKVVNRIMRLSKRSEAD